MKNVDESSDLIIAKLLEMGFDYTKVMEAVDVVGPCLADSIEFILKGSNDDGISNKVSNLHVTNPMGSLDSSSLLKTRLKQSSIKDLLQSSHNTRKRGSCSSSSSSYSLLKEKAFLPHSNHKLTPSPQRDQQDEHDLCSHKHAEKMESSILENERCQYQQHSERISLNDQECLWDWEQKISCILQKHFRFSCLKGFQKDALKAWLAHRDCLVLAATGSGILP